MLGVRPIMFGAELVEMLVADARLVAPFKGKRTAHGQVVDVAGVS